MVKWIPTVPEEEVVVITNGKEDICGQVIIISYELLNRKQYEFVNMNPQVVILDESHMIKNGKSARTLAVTAVLKETKQYCCRCFFPNFPMSWEEVSSSSRRQCSRVVHNGPKNRFCSKNLDVFGGCRNHKSNKYYGHIRAYCGIMLLDIGCGGSNVTVSQVYVCFLLFHF